MVHVEMELPELTMCQAHPDPPIPVWGHTGHTRQQQERGMMTSLERYPVVTRMLRSVNSHIISFQQYFNLIFGSSATYQPVQPSDHAVRTASAIFDLLDIRHNNSSDGDQEAEDQAWTKVRNLLAECGEVESLVQVTNLDGQNVLLKAVLYDDKDVISMLSEEGCSLNTSKCTLPLHLACKLGRLDMVTFLVELGALPDAETGMCYPSCHAPIVHVPSRFHFLETDIFTCDSNHRLPLMYAIEGDHLDIVKYLLKQSGGLPRESWPYNRHPLHYACKHGAYKSLEYLTELQSSEVNRIDAEGLSPLLHAVPWGRKYVKLLVEAGADVHAVTKKNQTALHRLYMNIADPLELHQTTMILLGTGMEQDVNRVDNNGNSPLHALISLLNRLATSFTNAAPGHDVTAVDQSEFDCQVLNTIEVLLSFNCDANIVSGSGVTCLHRLILMMDDLVNSPMGMTMDNSISREKYKIDFSVFHSALECLLDQGADPNCTDSAGCPAIINLLKIPLNIDPGKLARYHTGLLQCVELLCKSGANPSRTLTSHMNIVTLLSKIGQRCFSVRNTDHQGAISDFFKDAVSLLLRHGLNSNHCSERKVPMVEGASGNILLETVRLVQYVRQSSELLLIHDWVLTLLQFGADPDLEPYPSDPIICQSQSSIFLQPKGTQAVNQYMFEVRDFNQIFEDSYARRILDLFYNSMDHEALYQCMNTAKFLSRFDPHRAPRGKFLDVINKLSARPRTLQRIARVAIYKSLDRQLDARVNRLPLPKPMKQYLLNIE